VHVHESEERSEELGHVLPVREARALHHRVPRSRGGQARAQAPSRTDHKHHSRDDYKGKNKFERRPRRSGGHKKKEQAMLAGASVIESSSCYSSSSSSDEEEN
jgi:hypothetical protein